MEGGIQAWHGLTADGPPEGGIAYFASGTNAADMAALAWALEENTRLFYSDLAKMRPGTDEADLPVIGLASQLLPRILRLSISTNTEKLIAK